MVTKKIRLLLPLVISVALSGCDFIQIIDDNEAGGGTTHQTVISKTDGYYKTWNLTLTNGALAYELQEKLFEKHLNYIPYSSYNSYCSKTKDHESIEAIAAGSKTNQYFYTCKEASGYGTREHVWPCANSGQLWTHDGSSNNGPHNVDYNYYVGGGSDLFHVRTASSSVNTARGNSKFVDFDDPEFETFRSGVFDYNENNGKYALKIQGFETTSTGQKQFADKCEVDDHMKGDVARILTYVWIHYGDRGFIPDGEVSNKGHIYKKADMIGPLTFTNIIGYPTMEQCALKLVEWNEMDPPSEVEKLRNDTVQKIQGNRNPFVDFPELMDQLFDEYL